MKRHNHVIGIDPGCSGAIVVLQSANIPEPVEWLRMPTLKEGKASRVDCATLSKFLEDYDTGHAFVESVHSMPGNGATSMFAFGHAAGSVMGVLAAMHIPVTLVTPQAWKKSAGLIGSDKDAARSHAIRRWPRWGELSAKGVGQAYADAALIALHGAER